MTVNLSPLAGAAAQFFSNDGVPLSGGLLYTYAAGTSTPQTTYTTYSGGIANSNPIVMDSSGRVPNEIWLTAGSSYKFILKTSDGTLLGTWDNIDGVNDYTSLLTILANTTNVAQGDALIGFKQANYSGTFSGTQGHSVHVKLQDVVSVWDFMTAAQIQDVQSNTGSIDVTSAFNAALAASKGVYVPRGKYRLAGEVPMPDGSWMHGDGNGTQILCDTDVFTGAFIHVGGYCKLEKMVLTTTRNGYGTGVKVWSYNIPYGFTGYITVRDVNVYGFDVGMYINNIFLFDYLFGILQDCNKGCQVSPQYSPSSDSGYVTTLTFQKVNFFGNDINVYGNPTILSKNVVFRDCGIEAGTGTQYQLYFQNTDPLTFDNCYFEGANTIPAISLFSCDTLMTQIYLNDTGGIDLGGSSNEIRIHRAYGTQANDKIVTTGTSIAWVSIYDSQFSSSSVLNAARVLLFNTFIGATRYRNTNLGWGAEFVEDYVGNYSGKLSVLQFLKRTVSATVPANDKVALITDQYLSNTWNADFICGIANISNSFQPDLVFTVTTSTSGGAQYFCVFARNMSASPITLTNALLKVGFFKGDALAI